MGVIGDGCSSGFVGSDIGLRDSNHVESSEIHRVVATRALTRETEANLREAIGVSDRRRFLGDRALWRPYAEVTCHKFGIYAGNNSSAMAFCGRCVSPHQSPPPVITPPQMHGLPQLDVPTHSPTLRTATSIGRQAMLLLLFGWFVIGWTASPVASQDRDPLVPERLAMFLDCDFCDGTFIRQEMPYVDHVRDREVADVHILITRVGTGSGGRAYALELIGLDAFDGQIYSNAATTTADATEAEERDILLEAIEVGLVPFLMQTPLRSSLAVEVRGQSADQHPTQATTEDPWNSWTISMYADGDADFESTQRSFDTRYGIYISRVTDDWKLQLRPFFNYNYDRFDQEDGIIESTARRDGVTSYAVKSISPHWSVGGFADVLTSTYANVEWRYRAMAAVEWSFFPYREAQRRQLTLTYRIGASDITYRDSTIYNKIEELLPQHLLNTDFQLVQPWGDVFLGFNASQYLHEPSRYSLQVFASLDIRVTQGLSVEIGGSFERINDQINLTKGGADLEEVLLRRRQLETNYEAGFRFGFRYRFGSTLNNVVNTRLNGVGNRDRF